MKWSYADYDVTDEPNNQAKDKIAKILNDNYGAYNPLCIHTNIRVTYNPTLTKTLTVLFPTETTNVPFSEVPKGYQSAGVIAENGAATGANLLPTLLEKITPESNQIFTAFSWDNDTPVPEGPFGAIQDWKWFY